MPSARYGVADNDSKRVLDVYEQWSNYLIRAYAYDELDQYERAIQDLDEYIALEPYDANAYFSRAYTYGELGQYERAIEDLDEAIGLDPQYCRPSAIMGHIRW